MKRWRLLWGNACYGPRSSYAFHFDDAKENEQRVIHFFIEISGQ